MQKKHTTRWFQSCFIFTPAYFGKIPMLTTLPETNIAPENRVSQKETSIPTIHFRVLC